MENKNNLVEFITDFKRIYGTEGLALLSMAVMMLNKKSLSDITDNTDFPILLVYGKSGEAKELAVEIFSKLVGSKIYAHKELTQQVRVKYLTDSKVFIMADFDVTDYRSNYNFYKLLKMVYNCRPYLLGSRNLESNMTTLQAPTVIESESQITNPRIRQSSISLNIYDVEFDEILANKLRNMDTFYYAFRKAIVEYFEELKASGRLGELYEQAQGTTEEYYKDKVITKRQMYNNSIVILGALIFREEVTEVTEEDVKGMLSILN